MCKICNLYVCPQGCPNAAEPNIYSHCENCGETIYDGDEYYEICDSDFCEACILGSFRTAEV